MITTSTKTVGARGESLAEHFLIDKGYHIIERNWRSRIGEIDLIASKGNALHFVEVKTRHHTRFGSPLLAIHTAKQRKIRRVAEAYLAARPGCARFTELCFSCLGITLTEEGPTFEWLPSGFGM